MLIIGIISIISISIVIKVINFTVSSKVSLPSVDHWLLSSIILDKKHEEKRANAIRWMRQTYLSRQRTRVVHHDWLVAVPA